MTGADIFWAVVNAAIGIAFLIKGQQRAAQHGTTSLGMSNWQSALICRVVAAVTLGTAVLQVTGVYDAP